ncbi:hypothetical protein [Marinobacter alexandrii]|uniref:hypothetical protein n=1 Tax=Marinobacter alexandrii TaxID=2570351 RepID=UPI001108715E|nr:hypothetical protein [Marinobacter alexandrii]
MSQKIIVTGGRMAGRTQARAVIAALAEKGFEAEEIVLHHDERVDFPEVQDLSAHPQGKRRKPKKRKLKRKGGSKL